MLIDTILIMLRKSCKDLDDYTMHLDALMNELGARSMQEVTYDELCDYYLRKFHKDKTTLQ